MRLRRGPAAATHPNLFEPHQLALAVEQRIGKVAAGGEVVCDALAANGRLTDAIREFDGHPKLAWSDARWADIEPAMAEALG